MKLKEISIHARLFFLLAVMVACPFVGNRCQAVTVTMLTDEGVQRSAAITTAERNLGVLLTEINRAQAAKTILTTSGLAMDEFALKSLVRIWAITPFYCDDEEVVDRVWVFKDGTMMLNHVPLIITAEGETFGSDKFQEAVVEFDRNGKITDFRFALDNHKGLSMESPGMQVVDKEQRNIILKALERFRTAYNKKDIAEIERMFSDQALIITGHVVMQKQSEIQPAAAKVEYTKQTKTQYIVNLKKAFAHNERIDVKFSGIGDKSGDDGYGITRSEKDPTKFGVCLRQDWHSTHYSDTGYLFLLWEFPSDGGSPIIHVRTWQPAMVNKVVQEPDKEITTLAGFNL